MPSSASHGCATTANGGAPSDATRSAGARNVAEVVRACKERMMALCVREIEASGLSPIAYFGPVIRDRIEQGDDFSAIEDYLRLDDEALAALPVEHRRGLDEIVADTVCALGEVLDEAQKRSLDRDGLRPLLEAFDYPALAEFFCRINGLPPPGKNRGDYSGLFCPKPFEYAEVADGGRTYLCCPLQVPSSVGDATDGSFMHVWNSEKAQEIRGAILDGSFSHCLEKTCPALADRTLPRREDVTDPFLRDVIDRGITKLERGPRTIFMNYDRSCNLACPSCRTGLVVLKGNRSETAASIQEWVTADHLVDARRLHVTGSGDAFGSRLFRKFLRDFDPALSPELRISVGTNGLLLTDATWASVGNEAIDAVIVSVDGASVDTYRENRGGDFDLLVRNLHFIGTLRSSGRLAFYSLNFVVQGNNYTEMPAFVELGRAVRADGVYFQQITNWGTFPIADFQERAVHKPGHPLHRDFLRVLGDPILKHPMVDASNLSAALAGAG